MATAQTAVNVPTLTKPQLRRIREGIYKKLVRPRPRGLFTGINGETFFVPDAKLRLANFKTFMTENIVTGFNEGSWPTSINTLPVYHKLMEYSLTDYGAATIFRVLHDNKNNKTPHFELRYDDGVSGQKAQAGYNFVLLSINFPDNMPFKGGEKKHHLGIIHHEFGHTRFFTGDKGPVIVTHQHERLAVIHNDNPVRMLNTHEPRYTYHTNNKTINILTGATSLTLHTVLENDPTVLVKIGSAGAYRK